MFQPRLAEAALIGCLTALASFCALNARAGETYSIVAQSNRSSAATGRRPLSERIAAANLPIITHTAATPPRGTLHAGAGVRTEATASMENMAVAAVRVDEAAEIAPEPPPRPTVTPPVLWPFGTKRTATAAAQRPSPAKQPVVTGKAAGSSTAGSKIAESKSPTATAASGSAPSRNVQRQANAKSSGKGLSSSSPASVTR